MTNCKCKKLPLRNTPRSRVCTHAHTHTHTQTETHICAFIHSRHLTSECLLENLWQQRTPVLFDRRTSVTPSQRFFSKINSSWQSWSQVSTSEKVGGTGICHVCILELSVAGHLHIEQQLQVLPHSQRNLQNFAPTAARYKPWSLCSLIPARHFIPVMDKSRSQKKAFHDNAETR